MKMDYLLWLNYRSNIFLNFQPDDETETCAVEDITADVIIKVYPENEEERSGDVPEEKAGYLTFHYYNVASF